MINIQAITLFPDFFDSPLKTGILGRAISARLLQFHFANPRDFTEDAHRSVDDKPFGGGDGMLMMYHPLKQALNSLPLTGPVCYLSPQGQKWDHVRAKQWAKKQNKTWTFICGRYAGVDQRFINEYVDEEISIGDYVLTGGEGALLVIMDSLCRFLTGALGNELSAHNESFENQGLLEAPQWTRPNDISGHIIPSVMLSGHHEKIKEFRYFVSLLLTAIKRPDLLTNKPVQKDVGTAIQWAVQQVPAELTACGISTTDIQNLKNLFLE